MSVTRDTEGSRRDHVAAQPWTMFVKVACGARTLRLSLVIALVR
jgi:hypothetical protein